MPIISKESMIIFLAILAFVIIAFCTFYFNAKQVILRKLSKIKHKHLASLKTNELVKVCGKVLHVDEPLLAPLSKRKCVFYTIKIEKKVKSGKNSHWKTILKEQKTQNFFIEENGNLVIVKPKENPKNYKSYLVIDKKTSSGTFNDPSPEFIDLLKQYNINSKGFFNFNKQLRYREGVIEVGEKITVAGIAKWKNLKTPIKGYNYSKILELESDNLEKLIITDLPEAQNIKKNFSN